MLFSSLTFLFYFLPILIGCYFITPKPGRNILLVIFSVLFHAWGGTGFTLLLLGSVVVNWLVARPIGQKSKHAKKWLIAGITFNILLLVSFKYMLFFIENIHWIGGLFSNDYTAFEGFEIVLPLGISFFTFQQMSMLWDLHRMEEKKEVKFVETALYVILFPQLIAGPIVRYNDIIQQFKFRKESFDLFFSGVQRFILGLFKKVVIANGCGLIIDTMLTSEISDLGSSAAWLGIICYAFQIFFDFSGYSDMAIGIGRMFGFDILENFNFPYVARSVQDFWRRWHISLSSWFKDYVYIPLGGSKRGNARTYSNLFIVFLLTGFWHGATWSFVFWGLFHGSFLIIERLFLGKFLSKIPSFFGWFYTMIAVLVGWVYFRIPEFNQANEFIGRMFSFKDKKLDTYLDYLDEDKLFVLVLAVIFCIPWAKVLQKLKLQKLFENNLFVFSKSILLFVLFFYTILLLTANSYSPFIYFNF